MIQSLCLISPRGFCAGVDRAIQILEKCLEQFGTPVYVNHEIVHNHFLVQKFKEKGVIFEPNLKKIPERSVLVFSAHGVSPDFRSKCEAKNLRIIDATCPLVNKVHEEAKKFAAQNYKIVLIGHKRHQEIQGTSGVTEMQLVENLEDVETLNPTDFENQKVVCLTQTTLSYDETENLIKVLKDKIPHLEVPKDVCYASQNRQNAVKEAAGKCDFLAVLGSKNSSNSNRLVETAQKYGCKSALFDNADEIPEEIFQYERVGLTSGASVPEILIEQTIEKFQQKSPNLEVEILQTKEENLSFPLPEKLNSN